MKAVLQWVPVMEGGRAQLPTGNRFVSPARLANPRSPSGGEGNGDWSMVVLSFPSPSEQGPETFCDVNFLAPDAPHQELVSGASFRLLEGARVVALGVVL
jgi:hypothetical protein